jgi:serine/threonine-protein kinase
VTDSRYETLIRIGTGGMATVFLARPRGATHLVALKRAHEHVRADQKLAASMKREARLASCLTHPNVVSVLDVEESSSDLVLVLDYIEGCTLRELLTNVERLGEYRPRETLRIILDIAAGLHAAHRATDEGGKLLGLVHRDVSPSNVLVGVDGVSRISDFGIAKALFEGEDKTEAGVLKGKSSYMAPEYVLHQHANASSDLFSLAVMTWESLSGARLFKGATELETLERVAHAVIRPLASERPELAMLDGVLSRALSRLPADRQRSVEELAYELEAVALDYDLIASHAEVAELVERAAHEELGQRRSALRGEAETLAGVPLSAMDMEAETLGATQAAEPDTLVRDAFRPPRELETESNTAIMDNGVDTTVIARTERPRMERMRPTARIRSSGRGKRRSQERLALIAAFVFLALALVAMAIRLTTASDDGAPRVRPHIARDARAGKK